MKPKKAKHNLQRLFSIAITFGLAMALTILPLPEWAAWFRPAWVALVLIYWVIAFPVEISVGVAWGIGLLVDVLTGTVLGEHALALTLLSFIAAKSYRQIRAGSVGKQALTIFALILFYQLVILLIQGMLGQLAEIRWFWLPPVVSMLLWPWLFIMLRDYRRKFSA